MKMLRRRSVYLSCCEVKNCFVFPISWGSIPVCSRMPTKGQHIRHLKNLFRCRWELYCAGYRA